MRVVGLMSGTSLDGIDAVLMDVRAADDDAPATVDVAVLAFETLPYVSAQRATIHAAIRHGTPESLAELHASLGEWLADAVVAVCRAAEVDVEAVDLIGSHGQTIWHRPPDGGERGLTLQLGDPATIAERTGVAVVSDFRTRDVAAGGQGAPLVPWVDRLLFTADHVRVLANIGGMANVTRLPPRGSDEPVVAFDTGPGNALIDAAMELATDGARTYDADGEWARRGAPDEALLRELLDDPYFRRPPPKSTGRERFGQGYVERLASGRGPSDASDWSALVATLTALVARSLADGVKAWADPGEAGEVVVTGGGAENPVLMEWLGDALAPVPVRHGRVLGIDPAAKEAIAFGLLAWAHATGRPGNLPEATGAAGPRVLGSFTPGRSPAETSAPRTGSRAGGAAERDDGTGR